MLPVICLVLGIILGMIAGLKITKSFVEQMMHEIEELECKLMKK